MSISNEQTTQCVFLDTEFTDLLHPQLLSLGLATLDGREFYVELGLATDIGKARAQTSSDFVRSEVLDQWGFVPEAACTQFEMGRRTGEWLLQLAAESRARVEVAFDYKVDYELLELVIRDAGLWDRVSEVLMPVNVNPLTSLIEGELAAESYWREVLTRGLRRHHALADARALREAYLAVKDAARRTQA